MLIVVSGLGVLGLVLGSFASVLIERLPRGRRWVGTRSACPSCHHRLSATDLVPLLSFALLQGRCLYCKRRISWFYPVVELTMGALFATVGALLWQSVHEDLLLGTLMLAWVLLLVFLSVVLAWIDVQHYLLPDILIATGIGGTAIYYVLHSLGKLSVVYRGLVADQREFGQALIASGFFTNRVNGEFAVIAWNIVGAFLAAGFFYLLIVATRGKGMGVGDVKLVFLIGIVVGWPKILAALFAAFVSGAAVSLFLILTGKRTLKETIPFGPFLIIGGAFAFTFGGTFLKAVGYS